MSILSCHLCSTLLRVLCTVCYTCLVIVLHRARVPSKASAVT